MRVLWCVTTKCFLVFFKVCFVFLYGSEKSLKTVMFLFVWWGFSVREDEDLDSLEIKFDVSREFL